jgi:hypothetical protein
MYADLSDSINHIKEMVPDRFGSYFSENNLVFKDDLHIEILNDSIFAANMLIDSLPENISDDICAYQAIMKNILIPLVDSLLESERD